MRKNNDSINWDLLYAALTSDPDPLICQRWQQACKDNEQYLFLYNELKPCFEQADEPELADLSNHLDRINRLHQATSQPAKNKRLFTISRQVWWIAAVVLGICFTLWMVMDSQRVPYTAMASAVTWKLVKAPEGKVTLLHFPEGSVITLAPASILRYPTPFDSKKREVYLAGEAYFSITKDTARPFLVHSGPVTTKVTGTAFSVKSDTLGGEYAIKLVEGSVSLLQYHEGGEQLLSNLLPRQAFYYSKEKGNWHIEPMTDGEAAAIAAGGFVFKNTPLREIARQLELYYSVSISFTSQAIQRLEFSNIFEKPTLSNILHVIEASGKVRITRRQDQIIISPKKN